MSLQAWFIINRSIVLFLYGQIFFVLGLAIQLQSRRYSRFKLARQLPWLAAFGFSHGLHEWGLLFIPMQVAFLSPTSIDALFIIQLLLLGFSFIFLVMFGIRMLGWAENYPTLIFLSLTLSFVLLMGFTRLISPDNWMNFSSTWIRYFFGFPGGIISAWGLYRFTKTISLTKYRTSYQFLKISGGSLIAYAFLSGVVVNPAPFFPANLINTETLQQITSLPVEIFRSLAGLIMLLSMIFALDLFEQEIDEIIERMEVDAILKFEREKIGQQLHDGVLQSIYSASLIINSLEHLGNNQIKISERIAQVKEILDLAIRELRGYMTNLRITKAEISFRESLEELTNLPQFRGLVTIQTNLQIQLDIRKFYSEHLIAIILECLSNTVRHANASLVTIECMQSEEEITLCIKDNGRGFNMDQIEQGFGMKAIREHCNLIKANLQIISAPGTGTEICLQIKDKLI